LIKPCENCKRKFREEELFRKRGMMLCSSCRHQWRKYLDERMDPYPDIMRRTTTPEGEVVIVGKDVPAGYQDDPKIIQEKLNKEELSQWRKHRGNEKRNKEFWEKYRNNPSFKKQVDKQYMEMYRNVGVKVLRARGVSEEVIQKLMKEGR